MNKKSDRVLWVVAWMIYAIHLAAFLWVVATEVVARAFGVCAP